jgi:hypothetical protein
MDEIDLLRGYRADLPGPSAWAVEIARSRLAAAIAAERGRAAPADRGLRRWRPAGRRGAILGLAAAVVAAATAATLLLTTSAGPGQPANAAAAMLRHVALVAARQPAPHPPRRGQYFYTKTRERWMTTRIVSASRSWTLVGPSTTETWTSPVGSGRQRVVDGRSRFISPASRRTCLRFANRARACHPARQRQRVSDRRFPAGGLPHANLNQLPTEPGALLRFLRHRDVFGPPPYSTTKPGSRSNASVFWTIGELLGRSAYDSPKLRAALYRVASALPGVELLGPTRDGAGRDGIGVAYNFRPTGNLVVLIFDPDTTQLLEQRDIVLAGRGQRQLQVPPRTTVSHTTYLSSGVVDSPARPGSRR